MWTPPKPDLPPDMAEEHLCPGCGETLEPAWIWATDLEIEVEHEWEDYHIWYLTCLECDDSFDLVDGELQNCVG
jgi:hypothetical protein